MKSNSQSVIPLIMIVMFAAALASGCSDGQAYVADSNDEISSAVPVETTTPSHADINATYSASASIASDADAPVTAKVAGEVVELLVEEGDRVKAGQVLARLDGERKRLEMLSAKANLQRIKKEFERNNDLHDRNLVSTSMFEGLRFDLESAQATYDLKRLNYDYSQLRATISGVVSSREIKPGQHLQVGDVAFRITDTSELMAYLQIPQSELAKFDIGHTASLVVAAMPDTKFTADIVRISPTIDSSNGTFRATAIIDNADGNLAPGMFGRFSIAYETHENALVIPLHALLDEDDATSVYVVSGGQVDRRNIEVGIIEDGLIEVLGGLNDDEQIVVVGQSGLRNGTKVLASAIEQDRFTG